MTSPSLKAARKRMEVLAAVQSGKSPRVAAAEFHVSLSSVYNWLAVAKGANPKGLVMNEVDRRWHFGLLSADQVELLVMALVRHSPDITPEAMSGQLEEFGYSAPTRTVREVFGRLGLGTKAKRHAMANPVDIATLTIEELERVVHEIEAETADYFWPGTINLLQDYVKLPNSLGHPGAVLQIVVAEGYPKFGLTALAGVDKELLAAQTLAAAVSFYRLHGVEILRVNVPRGYVFDAATGSQRFASKAAALRIEVFFDDAMTKWRDTRIQSAKEHLWSQWLHVRKSRFIASGLTIQEINENLMQWVDEHGRKPPNINKLTT